MTAMNWLSMAAQSVSELPPPSWINSTELFFTYSPCDTCSDINTHLNNLRHSPLLIWFHPSVCFFLSPSDFPSLRQVSQHVGVQLHTWMKRVRACEHMHIDGFEEEMWCQISTWPPMSALLLIRTPALYSPPPLHRVRPPPHPSPQLIFFSSVKMKMRFITHVGRMWWVQHVACNSANQPAVRDVLSHNSRGWGLCFYMSCTEKQHCT